MNRLQQPLAFAVSLMLSLIVVSPPTLAYGNGTDFSYMTLKGIDTIAVSFRGFYGDYERYGVDEYKLRPTIEDRLKGAGVTIVPADQAWTLPGAVQLLVDVHIHPTHFYLYSYSVSLKVRQKLPLPGRPDSFVSQVIWTQGTNHLIQQYKLYQINQDVGELLELFLADYQAQNGTRVPAH